MSILSKSRLASIFSPQVSTPRPTPLDNAANALSIAITNYMIALRSMPNTPTDANFPTGIALINAINNYISIGILNMLDLSLVGSIVGTSAGAYSGGAIISAISNRYSFINAAGVSGLVTMLTSVMNGSIMSAHASMANNSGGSTSGSPAIVFNEGNFIGPMVTAINNYGPLPKVTLQVIPEIHIVSTH